MKLSDLMIPTNPEYDWEVDPNTQFDFVNPVVLNNKLMQHANAAITVTQAIVTANRKLNDLESKRVLLETELEDLEQKVLAKQPPTPAEAKTLKQLGAYIIRMMEQADDPSDYARYLQVKDELSGMAKEMAEHRMSVDNGRQVFQMLKMLSEEIKTHLSFVKNEASGSRFGT